MSSYPCTDDPNEVIEKIVRAKADVDKLNKFVNGGVYETVQLGSGSPTATLRNTTRLIQSASLVLDGSDVSGKFSTAGNGGTALRMLNDRFGDVVNVKDFGAVGSGIANDTVAFQAAAATGHCVFVPAGTYKLTTNVEGCFYSFEDITFVGGTVNGLSTLYRYGGCCSGIPARLSKTNPSVNPARLLEAIEEANEKGTYVCLPAGDYVFHSKIKLPAGTLGDSHYGYDVHLVGATGQYAVGLNRAYQGGDSTYHTKHFGTVLIYDGSGALFEEQKNFIQLKNISFRNESVSNANLHTPLRSAMVMRPINRVEAPSERTRVYISDCAFSGWAGCFGDTSVEERIVVLAERCRWTQCDWAVANLHDGRVVDSSINTCTNAFLFTGSKVSGFSTIANNRIEWSTDAGILVEANQAHNISIIGNEFDHCGGPAVKCTNGNHISVKDNLVNCSGINTASGNTSYHFYFDGVYSLSVVGNETVRSRRGDDSTPYYPDLCYYINDCQLVTMEGNDWTGCSNGPQLGRRISRYFTLAANEVAMLNVYGPRGIMAFVPIGGATRAGLIYYSTGSLPIGAKLGGGDRLVVLSGTSLPIAGHSYTGELVVSATTDGVQVWNTDSSEFEFNVIQLS